MEYLLVPAEVHLRVPPADARQPIHPAKSRRRDPGHNFMGDTGRNFMRSCRTARQEGLRYYYGQNTFYLPPGDIKAALPFFEVIEPHCAAMIKSLGVQLRITDELLGIFDIAVKEAREQAHTRLRPYDSLVPTVASRVQQVWLTKLDWIRDCDGYDEIKIQYRHHTVTLNGTDLKDELRDIIKWTGLPMSDKCNKELTELLRGAKRNLVDVLTRRLHQMSIESTRNWINLGDLEQMRLERELPHLFGI